MPKLQNIKFEKGQRFQFVKVASFQSCKVPKLKSCQNAKVFISLDKHQNIKSAGYQPHLGRGRTFDL
jgi:hypothetical protein